MLFATACVLFQVSTTGPSAYSQQLVGLTIFVPLGLFSVVHCYFNNITAHSVVFAVMILVVGHRTRALIAMVENAKTKVAMNRAARRGASMSVALSTDSCLPLHSFSVSITLLPL